MRKVKVNLVPINKCGRIAIKDQPLKNAPPKGWKDSPLREYVKTLNAPNMINWLDVTLTDIEFIRVRPAANPNKLAVTIQAKDGTKVHLILDGHYA